MFSKFANFPNQRKAIANRRSTVTHPTRETHPPTQPTTLPIGTQGKPSETILQKIERRTVIIRGTIVFSPSIFTKIHSTCSWEKAFSEHTSTGKIRSEVFGSNGSDDGVKLSQTSTSVILPINYHSRALVTNMITHQAAHIRTCPPLGHPREARALCRMSSKFWPPLFFKPRIQKKQRAKPMSSSLSWKRQRVPTIRSCKRK